MTEVVWNQAEIEAKVQEASAAALTRGAQRLRALSVRRAPVQDGPLRGSAQVHAASPGDLVAGVTYNTPYAVIQHEALEFSHPRGGGPKYLEGPLIENADELSRVMARAYKGAFG